jgi:hypothetical protein
VKRADAVKILNTKGVVFYSHGAKHDIFIHEKSGKKIPFPRHTEMKNKLFARILKEIPD